MSYGSIKAIDGLGEDPLASPSKTVRGYEIRVLSPEVAAFMLQGKNEDSDWALAEKAPVSLHGVMVSSAAPVLPRTLNPPKGGKAIRVIEWVRQMMKGGYGVVLVSREGKPNGGWLVRTNDIVIASALNAADPNSIVFAEPKNGWEGGDSSGSSYVPLVVMGVLVGGFMLAKVARSRNAET